MPNDAINAANTLGDKVDRLADRVSELNRSVKRSRIVTAVLSLVCVVILALVIAVVVNVRYSAHQASCVRDYTNQNADRANALFPSSQAKNDAQDDFVTSLTTDDQATQRRLFQAYIKAVRTYQSAQASHPLPLAPHITC